jgi:hypothetical protein
MPKMEKFEAEDIVIDFDQFVGSCVAYWKKQTALDMVRLGSAGVACARARVCVCVCVGSVCGCMCAHAVPTLTRCFARVLCDASSSASAATRPTASRTVTLRS